jgi:myo-inositol-1(or 4)-monophosphatase
MGFVDVVIETGLQPYDVQALMPVIEGAGGVITNWTGGPCDQGGPVLACGDPGLHQELLRRLRTG